MLKDKIQQLFYDLTVAVRVVQHAHWHLVGPEFIPVHSYLGGLYDQLMHYEDVSAEQILFLKESVDICLTNAVKNSIIQIEGSAEVNLDHAMKQVLGAITVLKTATSAIVECASGCSNIAAADVFSSISADLDQISYFLSHTNMAKMAEPREGIAKYYEDEQLVFGWASVAKFANGTRPLDWQGDIVDAEDLEPAVYDYVLNYGESNDSHIPDTVNGKVVESMMFTKEKMKAMGLPVGIIPEGWWTGFKIDKREDYLKVKSGEYKAFSIEGSAVRGKEDGN